PVEPVALDRAPRDDEPDPLQVPEHPRRPARVGGRLADGQLVHAGRLTQVCQGLRARTRADCLVTWKKPRSAIAALATRSTSANCACVTSPRERTNSSRGSSS